MTNEEAYWAGLQAYRCPECGEVWTGKHKENCSQPAMQARLAQGSVSNYGSALMNQLGPMSHEDRDEDQRTI